MRYATPAEARAKVFLLVEQFKLVDPSLTTLAALLEIAFIANDLAPTAITPEAKANHDALVDALATLIEEYTA